MDKKMIKIILVKKMKLLVKSSFTYLTGFDKFNGELISKMDELGIQ